MDPAAFLNYSRSDDSTDRGDITVFRKALSAEVKAVTGRPFEIFQDKEHILPGQSWEQRITESLEVATFLIPVLTPSYFHSTACREELERFLTLARRVDAAERLVLPLYYISYDVFDDESRRRDDRLADRISKLQYVDWRTLRGKPIRSQAARKALTQLAVRIAHALQQQTSPASQPHEHAPRVEPLGKADQPESFDSSTAKILYMPSRPTTAPTPLGSWAELADVLLRTSLDASDWRTLAIEAAPLLDKLAEDRPSHPTRHEMLVKLTSDLERTLASVLKPDVAPERLRAACHQAELIRHWLTDILVDRR